MKQDDLRKIIESRGAEDETYAKALQYTRHKCRVQGIDAALKFDGDGIGTVEFDSLLLCDRKGAGQQLAAQAGMATSEPFTCCPWEGIANTAGYPIITIPVGLDTDGFPVSLSFQHKAWHGGTLIK